MDEIEFGLETIARQRFEDYRCLFLACNSEVHFRIKTYYRLPGEPDTSTGEDRRYNLLMDGTRYPLG